MDYSSDHIDFSPKNRKTVKKPHMLSVGKAKKVEKKEIVRQSMNEHSLKTLPNKITINKVATSGHCVQDRMDLKAYIKSLEVMIDKVKDKYSRQKAKFENLKNACRRLQKESEMETGKQEELVRKNNKVKNNCNSLKDQNIILENQVNTLKSFLENSEKDLRLFQRNTQATKDEIVNQMTEQFKLKMEKLIADYEDKLEKLLLDNKHLNEKIRIIQSDSKNKKDCKKEDQKQKLKVLTNKLKELQELYDNLELESTQQLRDNKLVEQNNKKLIDENHNYQKIIKDFQKKVEGQQDQYKEREQTQQVKQLQHNEVINQLNNQVEELKDDIKQKVQDYHTLYESCEKQYRKKIYKEIYDNIQKECYDKMYHDNYQTILDNIRQENKTLVDQEVSRITQSKIREKEENIYKGFEQKQKDNEELLEKGYQREIRKLNIEIEEQKQSYQKQLRSKEKQSQQFAIEMIEFKKQITTINEEQADKYQSLKQKYKAKQKEWSEMYEEMMQEIIILKRQFEVI